jgi:signal transduction histidine kinase
VFDRIRRNLALWNLLVLGLILFLVTGVAYVELTRSLVGQVDERLVEQSDGLAQELYHHDFRVAVPRPDLLGYRGGTFFLIMSPDGEILGNPQQVSLPSSAQSGLMSGNPTFRTMLVNGVPIRLFARGLPGPNSTMIILIVGESIADQAEVLAVLLQVFVIGGIIGLVLSLVGAWFLAGRALVPIRRAFRRQQEFVADASHELRTPLTVLHGAVDLLYQHRAEPLEANAELVDDLRFEIARLERLTNDLLTLARSDQGDLGLALGDLDLGRFVADVARRTQSLARSRGVTLSWQIPTEPVEIEGDPDRLEQVLLILIDNAVKHSAVGTDVRITVRQVGNQAVLEVADQGEGIPPEHLPRVFERFYRADKGRSRREGSVGLGLAIARTFVEGHGGKISIASKVGVGTTVTITLPLRGQPLTLADRLRLGQHVTNNE